MTTRMNQPPGSTRRCPADRLAPNYLPWPGLSTLTISTCGRAAAARLEAPGSPRPEQYQGSKAGSGQQRVRDQVRCRLGHRAAGCRCERLPARPGQVGQPEGKSLVELQVVRACAQ